MITNIFQLINEIVPLYDLLDKAGVKYPTRERGAKVSCPFHGEDSRPSAYVYPDTNSFRCFTCNTSWDVVSFYAQANELWKPGPDGEDVLDMGRAIAGLKDEYKLEYERPAWELRFRELQNDVGPSRGYADFLPHAREQMARLYLWSVSRELAVVPKSDRAARWEETRDLLDDAEDIDLTTPEWKEDLNVWRERATMMTGGTHERHEGQSIEA